MGGAVTAERVRHSCRRAAAAACCAAMLRRHCNVLVFAVLVFVLGGCSALDLDSIFCSPGEPCNVDTPDRCEDVGPLTFFSPGGACRVPADCCDASVESLANACDAFQPGHPVPVGCTEGDMPVGLDCQQLITEMPCEWGDSVVFCCQSSE